MRCGRDCDWRMRRRHAGVTSGEDGGERGSGRKGRGGEGETEGQGAGGLDGLAHVAPGGTSCEWRQRGGQRGRKTGGQGGGTGGWGREEMERKKKESDVTAKHHQLGAEPAPVARRRKNGLLTDSRRRKMAGCRGEAETNVSSIAGRGEGGDSGHMQR
ncbi:hypothetical protein C8F04DRAFT_1186753 [Mycena alexandri]|uniref:Uncharacterized protein n=1 Tax=Mycena alexandri TaxID=1745969 RepID=A0AAD6SM98_9AGAR|nr:hypothetical protein C8F04DRAFT_1186753 [Mycena alexandri]